MKNIPRYFPFRRFAPVMLAIMLAASALPVGAAESWGRQTTRWGRDGTRACFTPLDIRGCQLWLAADRGVVRGGTGLVSQWSDGSSAGNHATQTSDATKPIWLETGLNGRPALRFDGNDDFMKDHGAAAVLSGEDPPFTLMLALAQDASTPSSVNLIGAAGDSTTNNQWRVFRRVSQSIRYVARVSGVSKDVVCSVDYDTVAHVVAFVLSGGAGEIFKNGTQVGLGDVDQDLIPLAWFWIGKGYGTSPFWKGSFGEIILYGASLTDGERGRVERYLKRKYNIN